MNQQRSYIQLMFTSYTVGIKSDILSVLHDNQYNIHWDTPNAKPATAFNFLIILPKQKRAIWKTIQTKEVITVVDGGFVSQFNLINAVSPQATYEWLIGG